MSSPRRPLRVAGFSGYLGDRATALAEAVAGDPVDVLVGDYLAEVTLAALVGRTRASGGAGYVPTFLAQLRPHLRLLMRRKHVDYAVNRLGRRVRVQRREGKVTRLGDRQGRLDRFQIAHFADEDHVWVLTKSVLESVGK